MVKNYLLHLLAIFFLFGCSKQESVENFTQEPACIDSQSVCFIKSELGDIELAFNSRYLIAEQPFELQVKSLSDTLIVKGGFMEGEDMYMGKIPLLFKQQANNIYVATSMFGACSEKQMNWRVWLELLDETNNNQTKMVSFTVTSYQSASATSKR